MSARPPFHHMSTSYQEHHSSSSSQSSHSTHSAHAPPPYRDYPPEKVELDSAEYPHHAPSRQQYEPSRGLYSARRAPVVLEPTGLAARRPSWRDRFERNEECPQTERLGKALILGWVVTTLGFVAATAFYKGELFSALDRLSVQLREMGYTGQAIFGFLIFLTTIPPLPLYSTLMVLSGYTFGAWEGFLISYVSSLVGAVVVFVIARTFLRDCITKCLSSSPTSMSLLNIIPAKPHLLLLIRIAPYPYNLLNVILASSPSLTLTTYTGCTAISLLKVILHTWFGSGIHDISEMHRGGPSPSEPVTGGHHQHNGSHGTDGAMGAGGHAHGHPPSAHHDVKFYWTWGGLALCVGLFVYLHHVAKKALKRAQDELAAEEGQAVTGLVEVGHGQRAL